jgi:hypothetical protein
MREPPRIPEEHLRACLQQQYDLIAVTLDLLPTFILSKPRLHPPALEIWGKGAFLVGRDGNGEKLICLCNGAIVYTWKQGSAFLPGSLLTC